MKDSLQLDFVIIISIFSNFPITFSSNNTKQLHVETYQRPLMTLLPTLTSHLESGLVAFEAMVSGCQKRETHTLHIQC